MSSVDCIERAGSREERAGDAVWRIAQIALAALVITFAVSRLWLLYAHKFYDQTGHAQWIWARHQISRNLPVAFYATRDFDLPPNRYYTRIKIAGDPEYTLWFNGTEIGGRRADEARSLDVYDVTQLARTQANRIVVAVRSADGVGGLIASLDITPTVENVIITDSQWHIVRRWTDDLVVRDPEPSAVTRPQSFGSPPVGRWNYLGREYRPLAEPRQRIVAPRSHFDFITALPTIEVVNGVAVSGTKRTRASVYDFGPITGRVRLTLGYVPGVAHMVNVRFANERSELASIEGDVEPFVFAAGEQVIVDPQVRRFRYVMVYGSQASAEVVK